MTPNPHQSLPATVNGGCHCGAVTYRVTIRSNRAVACNCSICTKKGFLHMIVPREDFVLLTGEADLTTYTFNTHTAQHHFCKRCGIHSFYVPRSHPDGIDVNVHCLDQDTLPHLQVEPFNGKEWEESISHLTPVQN